MIETNYTIKPIGVIRSQLISREEAPRQGYEGAPEAWLELAAPVAQGLLGITVGDELTVVSWLHHARHDVLQVHPRGRLEAAAFTIDWEKEVATCPEGKQSISWSPAIDKQHNKVIKISSRARSACSVPAESCASAR